MQSCVEGRHGLDAEELSLSIFDVSEPSNLVSILRYCSMQVQLLSNPKATWILTHGVENVTT